MSADPRRRRAIVLTLILILVAPLVYGVIALFSYYPDVLEILSSTCSELQPDSLRDARSGEPQWQAWPPGWFCDYRLPGGDVVTLSLDDLYEAH